MLYWLLFLKLQHYFPPFRIFRYLTFRTAFASLTALFTALIVGPLVINRLREFQIGQYIREEGPKAHQKKAGTPTMGGLLIAIAVVVPTLLWADLSNRFVWIAVFATCAFAAIGFTDDYTKVARRRNLGLTARAKLGLQIATSIVIAVMLITMQTYGMYSTKLIVPFLKQFHPDLVVETLERNPHLWGLAFVPFIGFVVLVIVGSSNAVNLTDGLDGLAIGCTVIAAGRADRAHLRKRARDFRHVSGNPAHAAGRRADDFLRRDGGVIDRISLVQRASRGSVHGRCGIAGAGWGDWDGRGDHQAGTVAAVYWRSVCDRSTVGDSAGGIVQAAQEADFQDGAAASSFRVDGMVGVEDYCAVLDCVAGVRAVRADDAETQVEQVAKFQSFKVATTKRTGGTDLESLKHCTLETLEP